MKYRAPNDSVCRITSSLANEDTTITSGLLSGCSSSIFSSTLMPSRSGMIRSSTIASHSESLSTASLPLEMHSMLSNVDNRSKCLCNMVLSS